MGKGKSSGMSATYGGLSKDALTAAVVANKLDEKIANETRLIGGREATSTNNVSQLERNLASNEAQRNSWANQYGAEWDTARKNIQAEMDKQAAIMEATANGRIGYLNNAPWGSKSDNTKWLAARSAYESLRAQRDFIPNSKVITKTKRARTFVNSFGEATTREITSGTYQRAQKRQDKAVRRNLGY